MGGGVALQQQYLFFIIEIFFRNSPFIPLSFCLTNLPSETKLLQNKHHNVFNRTTRTVKFKGFCTTRIQYDIITARDILVILSTFICNGIRSKIDPQVRRKILLGLNFYGNEYSAGGGGPIVGNQ